VPISDGSAGHTQPVQTAVAFGILVLQAALSATACHFIARGRPGVSPRRWTALGWVIGPAAILVTWWFAGRGSGASGLKQMRALRQAR